MSQEQIEIAALRGAAIHDPTGAEVAMTSPYLDHIRSPRRIIENLIAAREVELAKTTNAEQQQRAERDLRFLRGELARIGNPGHSEGSDERSR